MTDDEKRELIAKARTKAAWYGETDGGPLLAELADALEGMLTEPEWEYVILNGMGNSIYMAYSLREARDAIAADQAGPGLNPKRSLMRRRKAGPWEVVPE